MGMLKSECDLSVPVVCIYIYTHTHIYTYTHSFEEPQQLAIYSGDHNSRVTSLNKEKGSKSTTDDDGVDKTYKPGKDLIYIYIYVCIYMCVCVCVYVYMYIYTYV
jgi:hypothetical protein